MSRRDCQRTAPVPARWVALSSLAAASVLTASRSMSVSGIWHPFQLGLARGTLRVGETLAVGWGRLVCDRIWIATGWSFAGTTRNRADQYKSLRTSWSRCDGLDNGAPCGTALGNLPAGWIPRR